jgi:geranylgeranyl diphosphate synthase, type I
VTLLPGRSLPAAVAGPARQVEVRLDGLLTSELERWSAVDPELALPWRTLRASVLAGGKRLRPAFCFWSFVGAGGDPGSGRVVDAGAALEMLHAAALAHDDVIDGSARRHGADTAHVEYARLHREQAWRGDSERFGIGMAILLGDLSLAYCGQLLAGAPREALQVFDHARLEVNVGQCLDILGSVNGGGGGGGGGGAGRATGAADAAGGEAVARARVISTYKTAKYTVERPLHLGAALAAPERLAELTGPLSSFGLPLGEAFQLRDDLLGVFGDPDATGKPVGDDLREGKPTLLAGLARARAVGPDARLFERRFGSADLSESDMHDLRSVIENTGARAEVESTIALLSATAEDALRAMPISTEARQALEEVAAFVTGRDH